MQMREGGEGELAGPDYQRTCLFLKGPNICCKQQPQPQNPVKLSAAPPHPLQSLYHQCLWFGEQDAKLIGPWLSGAGGVYLGHFPRPGPHWPGVIWTTVGGLGLGSPPTVDRVMGEALQMTKELGNVCALLYTQEDW